MSFRLVHIAAQQVDGAVVLPHDLPGQGEADAGAFFFGGVERDKNLLLGRDRNGLAIVGHLDHHIVLLAHPGSNVDVLRAGLQGILDQVDENLRDLAFIGVNHQVFLFRTILANCATTGGEFAVQGNDAGHQIF